MTAVVAPSDLTLEQTEGDRVVRVGGRVQSAGRAELLLADALGAVVLELSSEVDARPGDLLVAEGTVADGRITGATVVFHARARETAGGGEFARLAWGGVGPHLRKRAQALAVVREYFQAVGFIEVDTPYRIPGPGLDLHVDSVPAGEGWLATSPEFQMKRLLVGGLPRIYQIGHCSRADETGPWHEPEFLMLEWYRAFAGYEAVIADTEQIVARVVQALSGAARVRLTCGRTIDVTPPFPRVTVRGAFKDHAGIDDAAELAARDSARFFELLVAEVEPALAQRGTPVFLTEYPITEASLARAVPGDPAVAERFELYLGGVELCNGFGELTDPVEQRVRFARDLAARKHHGRPLYPIDERFLRALAEGMPPAAGNALGLDRLVALACGAAGIAEVQAFPSHRL